MATAWLTSNATELDPEAAFVAGRLAQVIEHAKTAPTGDWHKPYRQASKKKRTAWLK